MLGSGGKAVMLDIKNIHYSAICAVREGRLETVRQLINSFGLSYSQAWSEGYDLLCDALKNEQGAVAKLLLTSGSRVNKKSKNLSNTPLHFAVINGDTEIVKMILDKGAEIDVKNQIGRTPLHNAIQYEKIKVVELLLEYRVDVNARDNGGASPLHVAAEIGCLQIVELLLKYGAYVNCVLTSTWEKGYAPLHFAVAKGNKEIVMLLLSKGANVDVKGVDDRTPLHIAAEKGYICIAEDLLNHGACIQSLTLNKKYTPLHFASELGKEEAVILFLNRGADINASSIDNVTPLHIATEKGHTIIVKHLLQYGAKVDNQDKDGNTILHLAVEKVYLGIVEDLLKYCPDINNQSNMSSFKTAVQSCSYAEKYKKIVEALLEYGLSVYPEDAKDPELLHAAAEKGLKIVEDLLKCAADVNSVFKEVFTLLHTAVKMKQEEVAKLLISYATDINAQDETGKTPIFYAVSKIIKLLLANPVLLNIAVMKKCIEIVEQDVDSNAIDNYERTVLHFTAESGSFFGISTSKEHEIKTIEKIAELFISKGANVNAKQNDGITALHIAVKNGHTELVRILLECGAKIDCKTKSGITPLHLGVGKDCLKIIETLLKFGADVDSRDTEGKTALHIASKKGCVEVVETLLKFGADTDSRDFWGKTALHIASEKGCVEVVETLLKFGADVDSRDIRGKTALHIASEKGCVKVVETLLKFGADTDSRYFWGKTALHIASEKGCVEVVETLLKFGADIDSRDEKGRTALHIVSEKGCVEIVETLLKFGADIDSRDIGGETALHFTSKEGYVEIVETLLKYGSDINIACFDNRTPLDYAVCGMSDTRKRSTAEALKCHIVKLKTAHLYINKQNLKLIHKNTYVLEYCDSFYDFECQCKDEIASMKSEKINNANVSFYDILARDTGSLAICMRNENVAQVFKSDDYKVKFPIYADMLENNFRKSMKRKELLEQANEIFHLLFKKCPVLPQECTEKIFSYLNDKDLTILMDAYKPLLIRQS